MRQACALLASFLVGFAVAFLVQAGPSDIPRSSSPAVRHRLDPELLTRLNRIEASVTAIESMLAGGSPRLHDPAESKSAAGKASIVPTFLDATGLERAVEVLEAFAFRRERDWWIASLAAAAERWRASGDPFWERRAALVDDALGGLRSIEGGLALERWTQRHRSLFAYKPAREATSLWEDWQRFRGPR